jgi:hypothetical protein
VGGQARGSKIFLIFFGFGKGSSPPVLEPAVMVFFITVDLYPTHSKIGGDGILNRR